MTGVRTKISPPWITYVNELNQLFMHDEECRVEYDNDDVVVKLYVDSPAKAAALAELLPNEVDYGNVSLQVQVIPANGDDEFEYTPTARELFEMAFANNPVFTGCVEIGGIFSNTLTYVVFKNKVVQFFNDNLNDPHGNISTLYQEIAKDVFADNIRGVCYCTDIESKIGMPLGEWP